MFYIVTNLMLHYENYRDFFNTEKLKISLERNDILIL